MKLSIIDYTCYIRISYNVVVIYLSTYLPLYLLIHLINIEKYLKSHNILIS